MGRFEKITKQLEDLDKLQLRALVDDLAAKTLKDLLTSIRIDPAVAGAAFFASVLTAIACDGRFSTDEYFVAYPLLAAVLYPGVTYEETLALIAETGLDSKAARDAVDAFVDGICDDDTKVNFCLCLAAICASDGNINSKEMKWIKRLLG